jgi:hypothetical protein
MSIETSRLRIYHFLLQLTDRSEVARQAKLGGEGTIRGIIRRHGHAQTRILEKIESIIPEGWEDGEDEENERIFKRKR